MIHSKRHAILNRKPKRKFGLKKSAVSLTTTSELPHAIATIKRASRDKTFIFVFVKIKPPHRH